MNRAKQLDTRPLLAALVAYALSSLFHHAHNATFLTVYPNLPSSLSVFNVYAAWAAVTLVGVAGYVLLRLKYVGPALLTLAIYGACGLDGLAHYFVADFGAHTPVMHLSILAEVVTGVLLIVLAATTALHAKRLSALSV